ncbi:hypothetical protein [Longitalea luteola]|nr:hypothetical protein [Longitalea luteola]
MKKNRKFTIKIFGIFEVKTENWTFIESMVILAFAVVLMIFLGYQFFK